MITLPNTRLFDASATRRAVTLAGVATLHVVLVVLLTISGSMPPLVPAALPVRLILLRPVIPPPPPVRPVPAAAPSLPIPVPDIRVAATPQHSSAPLAIVRATPAAHPSSHFGAATDSGLGLDVAATAGGGGQARGSLAAFEAAIRARVLASKHQPVLAWDRRNTCVVNYRVMVAKDGSLAGFSIDPCAVPEINAAARDAIRAAAPFPPPPELGADVAEVHGSMIFRP